MITDPRSFAALAILVLMSFCTGCGKGNESPPAAASVEPAAAAAVSPADRWNALVEPVAELAGAGGDGELKGRVGLRHKKLATFSPDAVAPVVEPAADAEKATIGAGLAQLAAIAAWRKAHAPETLAAANAAPPEILALLALDSMGKNVRLATAQQGKLRLGVEPGSIDKAAGWIKACKGDTGADAVDYQLALHFTLDAFYGSEATYTKHAPDYAKLVEAVEGLLEAGPGSVTQATLKLIANIARDFGDVGMRPLAQRLITALSGNGKAPGGAAAAGLGTTLEDQDRAAREGIKAKELEIITRAASVAPLERTATDPDRAKLYTELYTANVQALEANLSSAAQMSARMPEQARSWYTGYSAFATRRKEIMSQIILACAKGDLATVDRLQMELGKVKW